MNESSKKKLRDTNIKATIYFIINEINDLSKGIHTLISQIRSAIKKIILKEYDIIQIFIYLSSVMKIIFNSNTALHCGIELHSIENTFDLIK
jgi:hypothetical protein